MPYAPELAVQLITTLSGLRCLTSLGIRSRSGQISYPVVVPWSASEAARSALLAVAPRAMIVRREPMPRDDRPFVIAFGNRPGMPWAPLAGLGSARTPDPQNPLLQVLASLRPHEEGLLQILLRPASADWSQIIYQAITSKAIPWGDLFNWRRWPAAAIGYMLSEPQPRLEGDIQRMCEEKRQEPCVEATMIMGLWMAPDRAMSIARTCVMALTGYATPMGALRLAPFRANAVPELVSSLTHHSFSIRPGETSSPRLLVLTRRELAALWHLPTEATTVETILWAPSSSLMAPAQAVARPHGSFVVLGTAIRPDGREPVILLEGDRKMPLLTVGRTGTGKTSLMENLIAQDLAAGCGVALFDVHGDMTLPLLGHVPPQRIAQAVVIDTSGPESVVALNPLALAQRTDPGMIVGEMIAVLHQYFGELWSVGRMEDTMRAVLWALASRPGLSLADTGRLFHDPIFRQQLLPAITNPVVKEYWSQEYPRLSAAQQQERSSVLLNKVRAFLTNNVLRRMLTAPSCLDLRQHLDRGGILFVRPVGLPDAESTLLVGMISALLFAAARSRADSPAAVRRPCYLYLDEAQTVTSPSLPTILSQGRKFGLLCGGLALQYLEALEPATRQALLGNAGTFISFRCGPGDARLLQAVFAPLDAADLENLDRYHAVCKMQRSGATLPPFGLELPDPIHPGSADRAAAVLQASSRRYGLPQEAAQAAQEEHGNADNGQNRRGDGAWEAT